jgi:hypothetical protein
MKNTNNQIMKQNQTSRRSFGATLMSAFAATALLALAVSVSLLNLATPAVASGGSGSGGGGGGGTTGADTIKVSKCYYFDTGSYVELLFNASSSDSSAHLYAYLPDGTYLGEVQNGGGGRYGGTVFLSMYIPASITIKSSAGGSITVPCVQGQI